jgi:flavodoxin
MLTVILYDSKFGNTERVAEAIARGAGTHGRVRLVHADETPGPLFERPDLLLVGGPTQRRGMSPGLARFIDDLRPGTLRDIPAAAFDTRYRGGAWLMGSAARDASKAMSRADGRLVATPESFFIGRKGAMEVQQLEAGELERAEAWGRALAVGLTKP